MAYKRATEGRADQATDLGIAQNAANAYAGANREGWMVDAMAPALETADGLFLPEGTEFDATTADINTRAIPAGANILDRSNMYHAEGMFNFKQQIDQAFVALIAGANYRVYDINSDGQPFARDAHDAKLHNTNRGSDL